MIEFAEFLAEVSGLEPDGTRPADAAPRTPYPWQREFAQACLDGSPPAVVGVPTGSGKTTAVDALAWALAGQLTRGGRRTLGVRIVWAIDRRILVDEVHEHASRLCRRLDRALADSYDPLHETAAVLAEMSGDRPLIASRWRGGLYERGGLRSPLQPEVITSTVAQIGSRLLFRGYGVGHRSLSLAAGLAACDTTICLDEAHLADPFRQTAERVREMQAGGDARPDLPALQLIELTATPRDRGDEAILLSEEDKARLGPRWRGAKSATLVTPPSDKEDDRIEALVDKCLDQLAGGAATLACVVNTVARARRVWRALKAKVGEDIDLGLLIGPQRQADRERFLSAARRRVLFGGATPEQPLVVVATQTFEVGLDVDVEALVTESASSSALVQRLGRLNRAGRSAGTAVIVRDADSWLYQEDERRAWAWLESRRGPDGNIDVSVAALHGDPERPPNGKPSDAPLLTTELVERLVQTSPMPHRWGDPDVESFLKGAASDPTADVEICWRSDLRLDAVGEGGVEYTKMLIELAPPDGSELLRLNVLNARSLLTGLLGGSNAAWRAALADADIEGMAGIKAPAEAAAGSEARARFLVIRHGQIQAGGGDEGAIAIDEITPGDVVVLPTEVGGCDDFGLDPRGKATDVAPDTGATGRNSTAIRLTPGAIKAAIQPDCVSHRAISWACGQAERALAEQTSRSSRQERLTKLVGDLVEHLPRHDALAALSRRLEEGEDLVLSLRGLGPLASDGTPVLEPFEEGGEDVEEALGRTTTGESEAEDAPLDRAWVLRVGEMQAVDELERAALPDPTPPTISNHNLAVRRQVAQYIERLALSPQVRDSLLFAAATHDLGKADPRFQDFLHGGRGALGAVPVAKSVFGTRDPKTSLVARKISGLPGGFRHELESVAIVAEAAHRDGFAEIDLDLDLVLACVGAHHGQGLPVPGVVAGDGKAPRPFVAEVNGTLGTASGDGLDGWGHGEWLERYWRVIDRYGAWGFSYLLGVLILADRVVSSRGE
jgi:CRISPR-associated endonuclease/helicase Cas3